MDFERGQWARLTKTLKWHFWKFRSGESVNCAKGGFAITALGKNSLSIKLFVSAPPEAHRDVKSSEHYDRVCAISLSSQLC